MKTYNQTWSENMRKRESNVLTKHLISIAGRKDKLLFSKIAHNAIKSTFVWTLERLLRTLPHQNTIEKKLRKQLVKS